MQLRDAIGEVQKLGTDHGFTIVIVGGALVRLIGKKTTIQNIDSTKQEIVLKDAENPSTLRPEDSRTIIDVDCIAFSNADDPFTKEAFQKFYELQKELKISQIINASLIDA